MTHGPAEVEVDLFSGRPNPRFALDEGAAAELSRRLAVLPGEAVPAPAGEAPLGYRGVRVRFPDGVEISAANGLVMRQDGRTMGWFADPGRRLEAWLLERAAAALPGQVPPPRDLMPRP